MTEKASVEKSLVVNFYPDVCVEYEPPSPLDDPPEDVDRFLWDVIVGEESIRCWDNEADAEEHARRIREAFLWKMSDEEAAYDVEFRANKVRT